MAEAWGPKRQSVGRQTTDTGPVVFPAPKLRRQFGSQGLDGQSKNRNMNLLSSFSVHKEKTRESLPQGSKFFLVCVCV